MCQPVGSALLHRGGLILARCVDHYEATWYLLDRLECREPDVTLGASLCASPAHAVDYEIDGKFFRQNRAAGCLKGCLSP